MKPARTRIAPSPTGYMHIGTLRTALYDYFLARQSGGQFIIRIEDTDQERLVPGTIETLGIEFDEGPHVQSERLDLYKKHAAQLMDGGHAYYCFCTKERLEKMREEQSALKQAPKYDRTCLKLSKEEIAMRLAAGEDHVIRMKIPDGTSEFVDAIRGKIVFQNAEVDDQVLIKSDGFPTYHLAVVVDDHEMEITHVLRGEEWISSTPKQIILHHMFGWDMPIYAHVPLILNPDKTKLSKRKGDVSVESYLAKGYLPEALINFLALLGWNPTSDREIYSRQELIEAFDLSKVNKAGAVMNIEKLNWTNAQYLKAMNEEAYLKVCVPWVSSLSNDQTALHRALLMVRERVQLLSELPSLIGFLFEESLDYQSDLLRWKTQTVEEAKERLAGVRAWVGDQSEETFNSVESIDQALRAFVVEKGWGNGDTLWPTRVALSGQKQSPSPFECMFAYGKERTIKRLDEALARLAY